jgi:hypothetical protein
VSGWIRLRVYKYAGVARQGRVMPSHVTGISGNSYARFYQLHSRFITGGLKGINGLLIVFKNFKKIYETQELEYFFYFFVHR